MEDSVMLADGPRGMWQRMEKNEKFNESIDRYKKRVRLAEAFVANFANDLGVKTEQFDGFEDLGYVEDEEAVGGGYWLGNIPCESGTIKIKLSEEAQGEADNPYPTTMPKKFVEYAEISYKRKDKKAKRGVKEVSVTRVRNENGNVNVTTEVTVADGDNVTTVNLDSLSKTPLMETYKEEPNMLSEGAKRIWKKLRQVPSTTRTRHGDEPSAILYGIAVRYREDPWAYAVTALKSVAQNEELHTLSHDEKAKMKLKEEIGELSGEAKLRLEYTEVFESIAKKAGAENFQPLAAAGLLASLTWDMELPRYERESLGLDSEYSWHYDNSPHIKIREMGGVKDVERMTIPELEISGVVKRMKNRELDILIAVDAQKEQENGDGSETVAIQIDNVDKVSPRLEIKKIRFVEHKSYLSEERYLEVTSANGSTKKVFLTRDGFWGEEVNEDGGPLSAGANAVFKDLDYQSMRDSGLRVISDVIIKSR